MTMPGVPRAPAPPPVPGIGQGSHRDLERLSAARRAGEHRPVTDEEQERLDKLDAEGGRCFYCLGFHSRYCPRIRELEFHPNGNLARVAYWHDGQVDWTGVVFDHPSAGNPEGA